MPMKLDLIQPLLAADITGGVSAILRQWLVWLILLLVVFTIVAIRGKIPLQYNLRNLLVRWPTTLLISVAFALVVGLLITMLAFVNGMYAVTEGTGQPGNVLVLSEGSTDEAFSNLGYSDTGDIENQAGILRENDKPLMSRETFLLVNQPVEEPQPGRPKRRLLQLRGVDDSEMSGRVHGLPLEPGGKWISEAGVQGQQENLSDIEVVLGEGIAAELGFDRPPEVRAKAKNSQRLDAGDKFYLRDRQAIVVGVMKSRGTTYDSEIWAKQSLVGPMFGKGTYTTLVCRTANEAEAQKLADFFNNDYDRAALSARPELEYFESLNETNKQFLYAIIFLAVVMSIGGVFGVMNTMFAAISQRTKDIGVLRILGFKRWQILTCFLLESMFLALIGGLIGCAVGCLSHGWSASSVVSGGPGGGKGVLLEMVVTIDTLAVGLMVALVMGFIGGLVPSISATLQRPLESLR